MEESSRGTRIGQICLEKPLKTTQTFKYSWCLEKDSEGHLRNKGQTRYHLVQISQFKCDTLKQNKNNPHTVISMGTLKTVMLNVVSRKKKLRRQKFQTFL
jgi:hypothetical protein